MRKNGLNLCFFQPWGMALSLFSLFFFLPLRQFFFRSTWIFMVEPSYIWQSFSSQVFRFGKAQFMCSKQRNHSFATIVLFLLFFFFNDAKIAISISVSCASVLCSFDLCIVIANCRLRDT